MLLICVYTASCWCVTLFTLCCAALHIWVHLKLNTFSLHQHKYFQKEYCSVWNTFLFYYIVARSIFKLQKPETHLQCLVSARYIAWSCSIDHEWEIAFSGLLALVNKFKISFIFTKVLNSIKCIIRKSSRPLLLAFLSTVANLKCA